MFNKLKFRVWQSETSTSKFEAWGFFYLMIMGLKDHLTIPQVINLKCMKKKLGNSYMAQKIIKICSVIRNQVVHLHHWNKIG